MTRERDIRRERREPVFDDAHRYEDDSEFEVEDDIAPPQPKRKAARVVEEDDAPAHKHRKAKSKQGATKKRKKTEDDHDAPRRSFLKRALYWGAVLGVWSIIGLIALIAYHASKLPPIDQLAIPKRPPNIAILGSDGSLLANRGETGGREVSIAELPPYLPKAFVAIEDRRFYSHFGIDPIGIARAMVRNIIHSGGLQGGSTLTQQLAKNLFLTQERTASRKIQEAILAIWLERNYTKDQILELYLNRVYFGSGAYGVEAAAQKYFNKSSRQVSIAEAAMLAGLVQSPTRLAPNRNPDGAKARADLVLSAMENAGFITHDELANAEAKPAIASQNRSGGSINYAADYIMELLDELVGSIDSDVLVTTTINPQWQSVAEQALSDELNSKGAKFGVSQGALISLSPDGAIRAMVGGKNYQDSQFNRVTDAKRQAGSAFKPFVYLTALEKGLSPDTVREDAPINVKGWQPENYARDYKGSVTLSEALAQSLNTVAVRVGLEVGPRNIATTATRLGIQSKLDANASISLGTSAVTPIEMTSAYACFANGGLAVQPYVITEVISRNGDLIYARNEPPPHRVINAEIVSELNGMMREVVLNGTAKRADIPGWDIAGKTGTSQDFRDAWFIGYTSSLVTGVWLGNDDNSPTKHVAGGGLPVEVWSRYMKAALGTTAPQALPAADPQEKGFFDSLRALFTSSAQTSPSSVPPATPLTQTPQLPASTGNPIRPPADVLKAN